MKTRWNILLKVLGTAFLALLLLASPCSVRKSLESSLNIEHREVSNKSKATCSIGLESTVNLSTVSSLWVDQQHGGDDVFSPHLELLPLLEASHPIATLFWGERKAPQVPYYILYGNRKLHIA